MSTSGGFNPPSDPPCPYAPRMTRAAALALRAGAGLRENCVVVITDGPTIGTAGNTSATEIELNPVSSTDLGMSARVHSTFSANAWDGIYNIDIGTAGSIVKLTDDWNNTADDTDPNAPTVHTQVPWHKGSDSFRDNSFHDVTLTGWAAAGGTFRDNDLRETTVNVTGKTAGTFHENNIVGGSLTSLTATSFINDNQMTGAFVSHVGTGAGSFSYQNNTMLTGSVDIDAATTAQVTMNNNVFGGTAGGYRVRMVAASLDPMIVSGNRLFDNGPGAADLQVGGAGEVQVNSNSISAGEIVLNGPARTDIAGCILTDTTVTDGDGKLDILTSTLAGTTIDQNGSSVLLVSDCLLHNSLVSTVPGATRGLTLDQVSAASSTVAQGGTGSTNVDSLTEGSVLTASSFLLNSTSGLAVATTCPGVVLASGGIVSIINNTDSGPVFHSRIEGDSALNITGAGVFAQSRLSGEATLNLSGNAQASIIDGQFTVTTALANVNSLMNKAFNDWNV